MYVFFFFVYLHSFAVRADSFSIRAPVAFAHSPSHWEHGGSTPAGKLNLELVMDMHDQFAIFFFFCFLLFLKFVFCDHRKMCNGNAMMTQWLRAQQTNQKICTHWNWKLTHGSLFTMCLLFGQIGKKTQRKNSHFRFAQQVLSSWRSHLVSLGRLPRVSDCIFFLLVLSSLVPSALMFICLQHFTAILSAFLFVSLQFSFSRIAITRNEMRDMRISVHVARRPRRRPKKKKKNKLFSAMSLKYSVKHFTGFFLFTIRRWITPGEPDAVLRFGFYAMHIASFAFCCVCFFRRLSSIQATAMSAPNEYDIARSHFSRGDDDRGRRR